MINFSTCLFSVIALLGACLQDLPLANAGGRNLDAQAGISCRCPVCDHTCQLKVEETKKERTCYEIESKVICIPRVVFPWQKTKKKECDSCTACGGHGCETCIHNGAKLRRVCVAKPKKYTCPACKYSWKAEKIETCCDKFWFDEEGEVTSVGSLSSASDALDEKSSQQPQQVSVVDLSATPFGYSVDRTAPQALSR